MAKKEITITVTFPLETWFSILKAIKAKAHLLATGLSKEEKTEFYEKVNDIKTQVLDGAGPEALREHLSEAIDVKPLEQKAFHKLEKKGKDA